MSEEKTGLMRSMEARLPRFVENAYESIEQMQEFAKLLLNSKLVPHHLYEKLPGSNDPDFSRGKVEAVVTILLLGHQLNVPALTALQHVVPVNGLLSIKGDLAKSLIFNSGKLKPGSWIEKSEGSIEDENLKISITATRIDNGMTLTRSFSVAEAKRAGLWIDASKVAGPDGWRHKKSSWWKYPVRMTHYRALGFLARDLFGDVLSGHYTTEEAVDMPADHTTIIDQGDGVSLQIPDKEFAHDRSKKLTDRVVDKLDKKDFAPVEEAQVVRDEPKPEPGPTPLPPEYKPEPEDRDELPFDSPPEQERTEEPQTSVEPDPEGEWTMEIMHEMKTEDLLEKINEHPEMIEAMMIVPGKNTHKKLRSIIRAWVEGRLEDHTDMFRGSEDVSEDLTQDPEEEPQGGPEEPEGLIQPAPGELNKYGIEVPEFDKGNERSFSARLKVFQEMLKITPKISNDRFAELRKIHPELEKYTTKENFLTYATSKEIHDLLNKN